MKAALNKDFFDQRECERRALQSRLSVLFAGEHEATLELGCGHGHFLASLAAAAPHQFHVGIDKLPSRIERAQRKAQRACLDRLHFIHGDILDFIEFTPSHVQWAAIYMLFPDPWPKRRHHKHRWLQENTLHLLAQQASRASRIYFRTDVKSFFEDITKLINRNASWELVANSPWPTGAPTVFERYACEHYSLVAKLRAPHL